MSPTRLKLRSLVVEDDTFDDSIRCALPSGLTVTAASLKREDFKEGVIAGMSGHY